MRGGNIPGPGTMEGRTTAAEGRQGVRAYDAKRMLDKGRRDDAQGKVTAGRRSLQQLLTCGGGREFGLVSTGMDWAGPGDDAR